MPTDRRTLDLGVRLALIVAATISVSLDGPAALNTALTGLAFLATAGTLVRTRQLGWTDAVAVSAAGLLVVLVVVGFALDALPPGLTRVPWALGSGVLALAAVVYGHLKPASAGGLPGLDRRAALRLAPWYATAAVLAVVAIGISVHATRIANRPPIALSMVGSTSSGQVVVEIAGGRTSGHYDLVVTDRHATARTYGPFAVAAGHTVRRSIPAPSGVRTHIMLRDSGTATTLRSIVVGGTATPTGGS